jgi:hypothetical protein
MATIMKRRHIPTGPEKQSSEYVPLEYDNTESKEKVYRQPPQPTIVYSSNEVNSRAIILFDVITYNT